MKYWYATPNYEILIPKDAACICWGTCALNNKMLPMVARSMTYIKGLKPEKRTGLGFGSYGWSPSAVNGLAKDLEEMGMEQIEAPIACQFSPDEKVLQRCYDAGRKLAEIACKRS